MSDWTCDGCAITTSTFRNYKMWRTRFFPLECKRRLRCCYSAANVSKLNEFENTFNGGNLNDERWHEIKRRKVILQAAFAVQSY